MRLVRLHVRGFRCLADFELDVRQLNVLIGANAAGKSAVLDVLDFLRSAVASQSFLPAVQQRGGIDQLLWNGGSPARRIEISAAFSGVDREWDWTVGLTPDRHALGVHETLGVRRCDESSSHSGEAQSVLFSEGGSGTWRRPGDPTELIGLTYDAATCGLAAASVNKEFQGRAVAEFVRSWGFFDPTSERLRQPSHVMSGDRLRFTGSNLAARLQFLHDFEPDRFELILRTTRGILGFPRALRFRKTATNDMTEIVEEDEFGCPIPQAAISSGTLRLLSLTTALLGGREPSLIGIEEPENHLHPRAIEGFVQLVQKASATHQILITTHWPGLLDGLEDPSDVCIVRRDERGTRAERPGEPDRIREALRESGFGLGEYFETTGFGV